jgi:hypothetical protein
MQDTFVLYHNLALVLDKLPRCGLYFGTPLKLLGTYEWMRGRSVVPLLTCTGE